MDREKVIKGLEALQKSMSEHQCYTCSYEFIETVKEFETNICKGTKFCSDCGQAVKWGELDA